MKRLLLCIAALTLTLSGCAELNTLYEQTAPRVQKLLESWSIPTRTNAPGDVLTAASATSIELPYLLPEAVPKEDREEAPDFNMYNALGDKLRLSDFKGSPVVLNFWASWSAECAKETALLQKAYETLGSKIQFVMLNVTDGTRETKEKADKYIAGKNCTFPIYYDVELEGSYAYEAFSLPVTVFIDSEGRIAAKITGTITDKELKQCMLLLMEE